MSRSHRRVSRPLIVLLGSLMAIGAVFVLHKTSRSTASINPQPSPLAAAPAPSTPDAQPAAPQIPVADQPIETETPTSRPITQTAIPAPSVAVPDRSLTAAHANDQWNNLLDHGSSTTAPPIQTGNGSVADGQAFLNAGRLLEARQTLNDGLQSGRLSPADLETSKTLLANINQTLIFSKQHFPDDQWGGVYVVRPGDRLSKIAAAYSTTWQLLARINQLDPKSLRAGATIKVVRGPFFGVVSKKAFTMDIYIGALPGENGSMYVKTVRVGLGRDDSTPTGTWSIGPGAKLRHPTYYPPEGGVPIEADDPQNPLGGYWIALTGTQGAAVGKTSYGLHGTIDPDSIGKQASMGCIRLGADDIALVFDLMVEGKSAVVVND